MPPTKAATKLRANIQEHMRTPEKKRMSNSVANIKADHR